MTSFSLCSCSEPWCPEVFVCSQGNGLFGLQQKRCLPAGGGLFFLSKKIEWSVCSF